MKIDPTGKTPLPVKSEPARPMEKQGESSFASILEGKAATSQPAVQGQMPSAPPRIMAPIPVASNATSVPEKAVGELLASLERYQKILGDGSATLRDVAPAIEDMKRLNEQAQKMMRSLKSQEPVKGILQQTVLVISTEVERFNSGYYI